MFIDPWFENKAPAPEERNVLQMRDTTLNFAPPELRESYGTNDL
jgi:hypothetical protein